MTTTFDLNAIVNQAANESENLSEASKGGGGATPPNPGTCIATLVGYIELGLRLKKGYKGAADKKMRKARFIFELSGGTNKHTVTEGENPVKIAKRINVNVWLPAAGKKPSDKSGLYKLMSALNHAKDPAIKIPAQLLGKHVKVIVSVEEFTNEAGEVIKYGSIGTAQEGFRITPAQVDVVDEDGTPTGEYRLIPAPEVVSAQRCFLWEYANKPMWDSLFIEGEYEAVEAADGKPARPAKSKNVIQEEIKTALDWIGSPMQTILADGGELDTDALTDSDVPFEGGTPVKGTGGAAAADPLADML
ncbi:hypothetical protein FDH02_gp06 [Pseudomonas phage VSW-3]|uniref:Uncharacterized protein n=1 Tax=Pseudomonas phage VSW-3 TaxID=1852562 RepID=A0A173GCN0_9CAUD|nr:hypothetical protein FDH02_gp06 [Pseudomonas phage VSW-3]ANH51082.1 hypothetical protein VSW3_6 [Pseudomonas phage VSW-3]